MTKVAFSIEDSEYVLNDFEAGIETYFAVDCDTLEHSEDSMLVHLHAVQVLKDGQSPVGCNSCDLGDPTLNHKSDCPIHSAPSLYLVLDGVGLSPVLLQQEEFHGGC